MNWSLGVIIIYRINEVVRNSFICMINKITVEGIELLIEILFGFF